MVIAFWGGESRGEREKWEIKEWVMGAKQAHNLARQIPLDLKAQK